jgi:hypothetical protein
VSVQRKRGQKATVYIERTATDSRGGTHKEPDLDNGVEVRAAFIPQRSARAEVPGQQHINVVRMIVKDIPGVSLWCQVDWAGTSWDVVTPPAYHHGSRHVRHVSIDLRERPTKRTEVYG